MEGQVRTQKESERARGTHSLESVNGGIGEGTERNQGYEGHSLSGECRRERSEETKRKRAGGQGALTSWRVQMEGQVRTQNKSKRARGTHQLESAEGREVRTRKESERGALTSWGVQRKG
jgi:hypothetical protein